MPIDERRFMATIHLGSHSPAVRVIAHISDTHFLADGAALHGRIDTDSTVRLAMEQLERSGLRPDAFVITGDVADKGEPEAYRRVRALIEATAERVGAELIWVMGNHDVRAAFRAELLDESESESDASGDPVDRVIDCGGLRIIALDTSVPGFHHGDVTASQLEWLADVLATPAPLGSVLALHHPPVPTPLPLMNILELQKQDKLAAVLEIGRAHV